MVDKSMMSIALFFIFAVLIFPVTNNGIIQLPQWIVNNSSYITIYLLMSAFIFFWGLAEFL